MARLRFMPEADARMELAPAHPLLAQIEEAYRAGKYLWAYQLAQEQGPFESWTGARALCLAARLADNLGAPQRGRRLSLQAFRRHRAEPAVWSDWLCTVVEMRGPLVAWGQMQRLPKLVSADSRAWSDLFAFRARLAAQMKDFIEARRWLAEAELRTPGRPWLAVERAGVLELEHRFSEALVAAREALNRDPRFRPAYQIAARLLQLLDQKSDALELLKSATAFIESGAVAAQLGVLQMELGQFDEADETFSRCAALWPMAEPETTRWLFARRTDAACLARRYDLALLFASRVGLPAYADLAESLEAGGSVGQIARRTMLPVAFTCPDSAAGSRQTLASLSQFWSPVAMLPEPPELIGGDETLSRIERHWAEANGWACREFRVTWNNTVALIDRGVPFALMSPEADRRCLRAVVGYDSIKQALLLRDSASRSLLELPAADLKQLASSGPRGLVFVPRQQAGLLDGIELAEAGLYDRLHKLSHALLEHDRRKAVEWLAEIEQVAPRHRLTFEARWLLADYDGNPVEWLNVADEWLSLRPDDVRMQLLRLDRRRERLPQAAYRRLLHEWGAAEDPPPQLQLALAEALSGDGRDDASTVRLLRRVARRGECEGRAAFILARVLWRRGEFPAAMELFRRAAALEESSLKPSQNYFVAARSLGKAEEAITFLSDRMGRLGDQSTLPAKALFSGYEQLNLMPMAWRVLETALEKHPQSADLIEFAVASCLECDELPRAQAILEMAEDRFAPGCLIRLRARLAESEGKLSESLEWWRKLLAAKPGALDANAAVVRILSDTEGPGAGVRHLRLVCARFSQHLGLHELWLEAVRHEPAGDAMPVIQRLLEIHPSSARAHRAQALCLLEEGDSEGAVESARKAVEIESENPESHSVLALALERHGQPDASRESARAALQLSVDHRPAIDQLMALAVSLDERKRVWALIEEQLIRQADCGETLLGFRDLARGRLEPEELLEVLRRIHAARPDLWPAWTVLIQHLLAMQRVEEALPAAREATQHFPAISAVWETQALVSRATMDFAAEVEALERALEVDPTNSSAADLLAFAFERANKRERALEVLKAVCARNRARPGAHIHLASLLWETGQREEAIRRVRAVLEREPLELAAWAALEKWSETMDGLRLLRIALELTEGRPGDARAWLALAHRQHAEGNLADALESAEHATHLKPRSVGAADLRAFLFATARNKEEALAACHAPVWGGHPPLQLKGRAIWVEAELSSLAEAVRMMRELLAIHPEFVWGWSLLSDWASRLGEMDAAIHAMSQLVRLDPFNAGPLARRAHFRRQRNDRAGAKADLRQALKLSPGHEQAASLLFDLLMADSEFELAEELLAHIKKHLSGYLPAACETRLRAERSRKAIPPEHRPGFVPPQGEELQEALENFRALCLSDLQEAQPLEAAFKSLQRSRQEAAADAVIEEALQSPAASRFLGALWVRRQVARRGLGLREELLALLKRGEVGRRAIVAYVGELAAQSAAEPLRSLLKEHRHWLSLDADGWEAVGLALGRLSLRDDFLEWTGNWQQRALLNPELRLLLVRALRAVHRDSEADEVAQGCPTEHSRNPSTHRLHVWVAVEAAITGDTERGRLALEPVDPVLLDDYHRQIRRLARSLLEVQAAPPQDREAAIKSAVERLERAAQNIKRHPPDEALRRIFRRATSRLSKDCGRPGLRIWNWARLLWMAEGRVQIEE